MSARAELLLVGGGKMGTALVGGLLAAGWDAGTIAVAETLPARREQLATELPGVRVTDAPVAASGVIVAVKPGDVAAAARAAAEAGAGRLLSVAGGITIATLEDAVGEGVPVVRAMPNTPALVGAGVAALAPGTAATEDDVAWAEELLGAVGTVVRVSEPALDAVTGLSGSGPAYVFLVVEAMVEAGVLVGLPRATAETLAVQTVLGSARLLAESGDSAAALRAAVTSPGGTTAAGLRELERGGVRAAFLEAVAAATDRARELGG